MVLEKHGSETKVGGIRVEDEGGFGAGEGNDEERGREEGGFEGIEGVDGSLRQRGRKGDSGAGQVGEGGSDLGVVFDEAAVEASEAKEGTGGGEVKGQGPGGDGGDFAGVGGDTGGGDDVAEEAGRSLGEGALGDLDLEVSRVEGREDKVEVLEVLILGLGVDQNIVEVHDDKLVEEGLEDALHEAHEGGGGIGEAEGHDGEFIAAVAGLEGGLVYVIGVDAALMVAGPEVKGGEELSAMQVVEKLIHAGKGVTVLDSLGIEGAVVDAHAEGAVGFAGKEDRGAVL